MHRPHPPCYKTPIIPPLHLMSSVSRNTRSQTNPTTSNQKIQNTTTKVSGTDATTVRQAAVEKAAAEREAAIEKLVDTEAQIVAKRVANLRSLARPLLENGQAGQAGDTGDVSSCDHGRGGARGTPRGASGEGNHGQGRGNRSLGQRSGGLGQVTGENRAPEQGESSHIIIQTKNSLIVVSAVQQAKTQAMHHPTMKISLPFHQRTVLAWTKPMLPTILARAPPLSVVMLVLERKRGEDEPGFVMRWQNVFFYVRILKPLIPQPATIIVKNPRLSPFQSGRNRHLHPQCM